MMPVVTPWRRIGPNRAMALHTARPPQSAVIGRKALLRRPVVLRDVGHSRRPFPPPDRERPPVHLARALLHRRDSHARTLSRTATPDAAHHPNANAGRRCRPWRSPEHFPRSLAWYFPASGS